jgi:hypothetical protein
VLAPAVRRAFGGFAHWRAGYATTLSSRPRQLHVTPSGPATWEVRHVLVARDRTACGAPLERRFAVRWRVARTSGGWSVTALGATPLTRARACS